MTLAFALGARHAAAAAPGPRAAERARIGLAAVLAAAVPLVALGCGGPAPGSMMEEPPLHQALAAYGIELAAAEAWSVELGWQVPPEDCPHAYRLSTSYEPALRFEEDNVASLIVGRHPRQKPERPLEDGPLPSELVVPAHLFYQGLRAEREGATRDVYLTGELVGPASPTAACMARTWDPMEDALALGWPQLPGRLTAVGEHWSGLRVGGKCSRAACVDPQTGGGGVDAHALTCVVGPWQETLAGLYEHDGELHAWIHSRWSDGHGPGLGISAERKTLISVDHGRPIWSRTRVDHRFAQPLHDGSFGPVVRTWTLEAIDGCPGSLAATGWERPAELVDEETRLRDQLAHADRLRKRTRRAADEEHGPFAE
ncbi:hypothetical protein [Paraliomyxa miuraensis]|uniref:hypothetical protein n=1 Tax=Paraliomyxa miuraensis TaxID=376150 RepID=UPI002252027D|nr:hypothetical protein [Paraliomyxa miuraensis]MCX4241120.1 hypothetical protein [Paraliomyxa miuraensis]